MFEDDKVTEVSMSSGRTVRAAVVVISGEEDGAIRSSEDGAAKGKEKFHPMMYRTLTALGAGEAVGEVNDREEWIDGVRDGDG